MLHSWSELDLLWYLEFLLEVACFHQNYFENVCGADLDEIYYILESYFLLSGYEFVHNAF